jgi:uncharacterized protein (TIGR00288 family)
VAQQDGLTRTEVAIAVFVDFENLALGVQDMKGARFEIELVLRRLLEKGRIVAKRAYCDWTRYREFMQEFHRNGFEMVDIPQTKMSGKNSADIRMVVDALDMCYSKGHIDTFVLLTGDSDFSPLVSKLKENDKHVIGCGVRNSTSDLLAGSCDEFIFYDDLITVSRRQRTRRAKPAKEAANPEQQEHQEAIDRVSETVESLAAEYDPLWGSLVKQTVRRKYPGFNEAAYGFKSFSALLEEAAKQGLIELEFDQQRGNYKIRAR